MPQYDKEENTVQPEPVDISLITGGIPRRKKGKKGKKQPNRYAGLF